MWRSRRRHETRFIDRQIRAYGRIMTLLICALNSPIVTPKDSFRCRAEQSMQFIGFPASPAPSSGPTAAPLTIEASFSKRIFVDRQKRMRRHSSPLLGAGKYLSKLIMTSTRSFFFVYHGKFIRLRRESAGAASTPTHAAPRRRSPHSWLGKYLSSPPPRQRARLNRARRRVWRPICQRWSDLRPLERFGRGD